MRACDECGAEIPDEAVFCSMCGSAQTGGKPPAEDAPAAEDRRRDTRKGVLIAGAVVLVLMLAGAITAFLLWGRTVEGAVVSLSTGMPVPDATIECDSGVAKSDASGHFSLTKLQLGTHDVTVTVAGFDPFRASLQVRPLGAGESEIKLPDASVTVHVEEAALQPKAVDASKVQVASLAASLTAPGTYELKGLRPGETTITVTGSSHEPTKAVVSLEPGKNDVGVHVHLTPAETYVRYFQAYKAGQWKAAYAYLHPDVAKRASLAAYTKDMKSWGTPVSITMDSTRMLPTWASPFTKLTYANVAEIHRTLETDLRGARHTSGLPQHWANVGGLWLRVDY